MSDPYIGNVSLLLNMNGADNGTVFTDEKGKTVTAVGNVVTKTAEKKYGSASAYFDGNGDYLSIPSHEDFRFGFGDFTVEAWVYLTKWDQVIIDHGDSTIVGTWRLYVDSAGHLNWLTSTGSAWTTVAATTSTSVVTKHQWVFLSVTRSGGVTRTKINGSNTGVGSGADNVNYSGAPTLLTIGAQVNQRDATKDVNGYIDDVRITKGVARYGSPAFNPPGDELSSTWIDPYINSTTLLLHMDGADNGTVFTDEKGNTVTAFGDVVTKIAEKKFGFSSAYFDGTGDYLSISSRNIYFNGDFTVEAWVYLTDWDCVLFENDNYPNRWHLYVDASGHARWLVTGASTVYASGPSIAKNQWVHVAVVRFSGVTSVALNGSFTPGDSDTLTNAGGGATLRIGLDTPETYPLQGYVDEVRITDGIARYPIDFSVPTRAFYPGVLEGDMVATLPALTGESNGYNVLEANLPALSSALYSTNSSEDLYADYVTLLLHMDGVDDGTLFIDEKGKTVTAVGNAVTKTAEKKFGWASAKFDGSGDYLSVPGSADFRFGTGPFTVEAWVYLTKWDQVIIDHATTGNAGGWQLYVTPSGTLRWSKTDGSGYVTVGTTVATVPKNQWVHIAVSRGAGTTTTTTTRLWIDGGSSLSVTGENTNYSGTPSLLTVGAQVNSRNSTYDVNGYIDEVRITKGVGRYDAGFTPATQPFYPSPSTGVLDASLPVPTSSFVGNYGIETSLPSLVGDLTNFIYGEFASDLPALTSYLYGSPIISFDLDVELPSLTSSLNSLAGRTGQFDLRLPKLTTSFDAGSQSIDADLPAITGAFGALVGTSVGFSTDLPAMESSLSGVTGKIASFDLTLPAVTGTFDAISANTGQFSGRLSRLGGSLNGSPTGLILLNGELPAVSGTLTAYTTYYATIPDQTLTSLTGILRGSTTTATALLTHVANTLTSAVTTFANYPFNSMVKFNGIYYGASDAGLFKLEDSASTEVRSGVMKTGALHFGSEMQKRMSDFYLGMRSKGDVTLRVTTDELDPYEYVISTHGVERLKQRRSLIGKGAKGKYWEFELECGEDFEFDTMNAAAVPVSRRL